MEECQQENLKMFCMFLVHDKLQTEMCRPVKLNRYEIFLCLIKNHNVKAHEGMKVSLNTRWR